MEQTLIQLSDLNHKIKQALVTDEIEHEEIQRLVDNREQILQTLLNYIDIHPDWARSQEWQAAVAETAALVELMQSKTAQIGETLRRYRHGNKSVQQYKRFL